MLHACVLGGFFFFKWNPVLVTCEWTYDIAASSVFKGMIVWRDFREDEKLRKEKWREIFLIGVWLGEGEKKMWWIQMFSS